jgi:hypothetical protein
MENCPHGGGLEMESGEELLTDVAARDEAIDSSVRLGRPLKVALKISIRQLFSANRRVPGSSIVPLDARASIFPHRRSTGPTLKYRNAGK